MDFYAELEAHLKSMHERRPPDSVWLGHSDGGVLVGKVYGHLAEATPLAEDRDTACSTPAAGLRSGAVG